MSSILTIVNSSLNVGDILAVNSGQLPIDVTINYPTAYKVVDKPGLYTITIKHYVRWKTGASSYLCIGAILWILL